MWLCIPGQVKDPKKSKVQGSRSTVHGGRESRVEKVMRRKRSRSKEDENENRKSCSVR